MAAPTVADLIMSALRLISGYTPGETPTDAEMQDGLLVLNDMIDSWNIDPLMILTFGSRILNLVPGQQVYTIGIDPSGVLTADFPFPRPAKITNANIITQIGNTPNPTRVPLELLNTDGWSGIAVQNTGSSIPQQLYDDYASPLSNLKFWPLPNAAAQFEYYAWTALSQYSAITDSVVVGPGYSKAIRYNLAVDLAPEFGVNVPPAVAEIAAQSKMDIQAHNSPELVMSCDPALSNSRRSSWNYLSDTWSSGGNSR